MRFYFEAETNEGVECGSVEAQSQSEAEVKMEAQVLGLNPDLRITDVHFEMLVTDIRGTRRLAL